MPLRQPKALRPALRALSCCATAPNESLAGTVTEYHQHLLLQLPRPAASAATAQGAHAVPAWPKLIERESAVVAAFAAVAKYQDYIGGKVKVTAFEEVPTLAGGGSNGAAGPGSSRHKRPQQQQQQQGGPAPGTCNLLAFPSGQRYDAVPIEKMGLAAALALADNPADLPIVGAAERRVMQVLAAPVPNLALFVCCHAARDARCGSLGLPLAASLQQLVQTKGLERDVRVYQTSHVGGHKHAGNVLVYGAMHPCDGDWFGGISVRNAEAFLEALLGVEFGVDGGAQDPALRPFWRGRMGLSKEEQLQLYEQGGSIEVVEELAADEDTEEEEAEGEDEIDWRLEWALRERRH